MPFTKHEPLENEKECLDPEHKPPTHILLKPGKHTYECPKCGKVTEFYAMVCRR